MKRRILSLVMVLFMMLSTIPSMSVMVSAATEGYYTFTVSGGRVTITGFDKSVSGDIKIPNTIGGCPVIAVRNGAFSECSALTSIEIPDSVTTIGDGAFSYCSALTSIEIPDSVTTIGNSAFSNCSALTSIEIPDSVTSIGGYAFHNCYIDFISFRFPVIIIYISASGGFGNIVIMYRCSG